jgi:putative membrane protein
MRVGTIPIIVGPLWFGMGYFAWVVAGTLLGGTHRRLSGKVQLIALPIVAAFVMAQWDVVMDPPEATISKAWIWHDGGAHFGVPISNYLGWLLTSWLFYQAFAIYLIRRHDVPTWTVNQGRAFSLSAILLYLCSGLTHVTPWVMGQSGDVVDAAGHVWRIGDLRETTVVVLLFTMVFTSMLAGLRLATDAAGRRAE